MPNEPKFYHPVMSALQAAIDSTGASRAKIAAAGKLSSDTLKNALLGKRVLRAKAHGITNGLNESGANPKVSFEELFKPEETEQNG